MDVEDKYQNEKDDGIVDFDDLSWWKIITIPNCNKFQKHQK